MSIGNTHAITNICLSTHPTIVTWDKLPKLMKTLFYFTKVSSPKTATFLMSLHLRR